MSDQDRSEHITVDAETCSLHVENLGFTLRTLLGAAANGYKINPQRRWKIVYKGVRIGGLTLKDTHLKEENDSNGTSVKSRTRRTTKPDNRGQASDAAHLGVVKRSSRLTSKGGANRTQDTSGLSVLTSSESVQSGDGGADTSTQT